VPLMSDQGALDMFKTRGNDYDGLWKAGMETGGTLVDSFSFVDLLCVFFGLLRVF
jgi:hypothetical protein